MIGIIYWFRFLAKAAVFLTAVFVSMPVKAQDLGQLKNEDPFRFSGSLNTSAMVYSMKGIEERSVPFTYLLSGNINASVYGVDIPLSFYFSEKERSFRQPFNQFGLSPTYKWIKIHAGYRNLQFSNYTLASHSIFGAGFELNPGQFRIAFIWGRFNRSTGGNVPTNSPDQSAYKRMGIAMKFGYGSQKRFFDLIFLKAADDSTSLIGDYSNAFKSPAANVVLGYNARYEFKKNIQAESELGYSVYTSNLSYSEPVVKKYLFQDFLSSLVQENVSTIGRLAMRHALKYKYKNYGFGFQARRVGPGYQSMGTYFLFNDMQHFTIDPSANFPKQRIGVRASFGIQQDNLSNEKKVTSNRKISSVVVNYNPKDWFGLDAVFSNMDIQQKAGNMPIYDSTKIYQSNLNASLMPRWMKIKEKISHVVMFTLTYMKLNDKNNYTASFAEYDNFNLFLNYNLSLPMQKLNVSAGINHTSVVMQSAKSLMNGLNVSVGKNWKDGKIQFSAPLAWQWVSTNGMEGAILSLGINLSCELKQKHLLQFVGNFINNTSEISGNDFTEIRSTINYSYRF